MSWTWSSDLGSISSECLSSDRTSIVSLTLPAKTGDESEKRRWDERFSSLGLVVGVDRELRGVKQDEKAQFDDTFRAGVRMGVMVRSDDSFLISKKLVFLHLTTERQYPFRDAAENSLNSPHPSLKRVPIIIYKCLENRQQTRIVKDFKRSQNETLDYETLLFDKLAFLLVRF